MCQCVSFTSLILVVSSPCIFAGADFEFKEALAGFLNCYNTLLRVYAAFMQVFFLNSLHVFLRSYKDVGEKAGLCYCKKHVGIVF